MAADDGVGGEVAVADVGADAQRAVGEWVDVVQGEVADVDDAGAGSTTPSFMWSTRLVPPARKTASGRSATAVTASSTLVARWYSKGIIGRPGVMASTMLG